MEGDIEERHESSKRILPTLNRELYGGNMFRTEDLTTNAIAELAKEGMAFAIEIGANGKKLYRIDSVALSEPTTN